MIKYSDMDAASEDMLKEIGNIGTGNAITALSAMVGKTFSVELPEIRIVNYQDTPELLGGPETLGTGIMLEISDDLSGIFMFLLNESFTQTILNALLGEAERDLVCLDEMSSSAICEIGNVMCGAYINALAQLMGIKVHVSVPDISCDMIGAILSVPMIHFANLSDELMLIENKFTIEGNDFTSHVLFLPEIETLDKIFQVLNR